MSKLIVYIDDIRPLPQGFDQLFKTGEEFIQYLMDNPHTQIQLASFDHDLGLNVMDGYELIKQLVELNPQIEEYEFHTDNIIGFTNMYHYVLNARKHGVLTHAKTINTNKVKYINGQRQ